MTRLPLFVVAFPMLLSSNEVVSISIDYTLWVARADDIFILDDTGLIYPEITSRSGLRVGLSYHLDGLLISSKYTWFYNENNTYDLLPNVWNNSFNELYLRCEHNCLCGNLSVTPFIGILSAWDYQLLTIYVNESSDNYKQNAWGIGPYLGVLNQVPLGKGTAINISSGISLPWTRYMVESRYRDRFSKISPLVDILIGLSWETAAKWELYITLGWELTMWFNHNHLRGLDYVSDYSMQGLTISGRVSI